VVNAKDALFDKESGASIKVETTVDSLVEGNEGEQFFILKVTDNGCGMNEQTLEHLFETSYTTKAERGGTGLGLSIVRQMVENHSGKIEVESVLGAGTTFTVSLKAEEKPAEKPVPSEIEAA
jgi:signal transduction histidine kinase